MLLPLEPRLVERCDAGHAELADAVGYAVLRAYALEEGIPAVGDWRSVEEGFVEGDELATAPLFYTVNDGLVLRRGHLGVVGNVWEAHLEGVERVMLDLKPCGSVPCKFQIE